MPGLHKICLRRGRRQTCPLRYAAGKQAGADVPEAREAMDKFKMEAASEVGVNLKEGYNGDLSSREAGSVGGQMVKKMIESYEKSL